MKYAAVFTLLIASLMVLSAVGSFATGPKEEVSEAPKMEMADPDIIEIASSDGRFTTLVAAIGAADLVETLQGEGPFTVFAPTDDAFAKLPEGTVEALLGDIPTLTNILLYHVVSGKVLAADVVGLSEAEAVSGELINIRVEDGKVLLNGNSQVIITDIEAANGVIHVIDTVILPEAG
jgi:uncharacterized surface protein with fasciclin (FAS1) repeats